MSLATLDHLLAERQRLRAVWRELQDHATAPDFALRVEAVGAQLDRTDDRITEVVEKLNDQGIRIPGETLYDIAESALERHMRRNEDNAGRRLHDALEIARWMK